MKKTIVMSATIVAAMSLAACHEDGKKVIDFSELPLTAQTFVQTHFTDKLVSTVFHDNEVADNEYEVIFTDGANIDFTSNGEWDEVEDRDTNGVPTAIIPLGVIDYVAANHAGLYVVQIGKDRNNYDVELNNTIELVFNKNGEFLRYDD
ncbi:MAG: PepSY-like domain-containing protein [Bacteroidales bacterium]|nr:PepSY-like domain-containing protein [Bacteroidales bacterium]